MITITLIQYISIIVSTALAFYLLGKIKTWEDVNYNERPGKKHKRRY